MVILFSEKMNTPHLDKNVFSNYCVSAKSCFNKSGEKSRIYLNNKKDK